MLLAEINDEWVRWIVEIVIVSILALFRWTAKGSSKLTEYENKVAEATRVAHSAHAKLAIVTPRIDQLERDQSSDRAQIHALSSKLDEKAGEIREDIQELRSDIKTALGKKG